MNGFQFERFFVQLVSEISFEKGLKAKPLAEKAWPLLKDAGTKWRKIRNGDPPQELSMRDAYDLACAMGVSITDLCGAVQSKALKMEIKYANSAEKKEVSTQLPQGRQAPLIKSGTTYKN